MSDISKHQHANLFLALHLIEKQFFHPELLTSVIHYTYDDNNRLMHEDDIRYYYDNNGNLIKKNSAEENILYVYNAENHVIRGETSRYGATIVVEYEYDLAR